MIFNYKTFDPTKQNAIIQASAGTGKTFSVQEIVKKLVFNNEYNLASNDKKEEIANNNLKKVLIVTFTEKATGELKDRIRDELDNELKNRIENNLDDKDLSINFDINSFNIFTIHSFCQNSIKEFCVDANLPIGLQVITNEKYYLNNFIDKYIREGNIYLEINDFVNRLPKLNLKSFLDGLKNTFMSVISNYFNDDKIISLKYFDNKSFNDYYNSDPVFKNHCDNLKNSSDEVCKVYFDYLKNITDMSQIITDFSFQKNKFDSTEINDVFDYFYEKKQLKAKARFVGATLSDMISNNKELDSKYDILLKSGNIKALMFSIALKRKSSNNKIDFTSSFKLSNVIINQTELDAVNYISNISYKTINKDESPDKYLVVKYFKDLYKLWQDEKIKNKQQSFNDMIFSVRESLKSNPKFRKSLKEKYNFAIIDEFQDTNQLQFDIFKSIFMEDDKHRIIVVGDPKQSIYQFQGADLNVYEEAKTEILNNTIVNGVSYDLDTNWRSTKDIIESCNEFFKNDYFSRNISGVTLQIPFTNSNYSGCGKEASYLGKPVKAFWVGGRDDAGNFEKIDPDIYSEEVVKQIIDFCSFVPGTNKTKLQIRPKDIKDKKTGKMIQQQFRNVSFSDFTILYKVRTESEHIERVLKRCGVPYIKFKDKKLFGSKECAHFITILEAIISIDFTGNNRRLFKKALFTDFFNLSLSEIADERFNRDDNDEIDLILKWKELAKNKKWENLIDHIIDDSNISKRLCTTEKIQSLTIYKQLADYIISYLYDNNSISDLIYNLKTSSRGSSDDEDEGIIEVGVDLNSVKLMTIHASKGLQFPIVCSIAGFKDRYTKSNTYIYHDKNLRKISFESTDSKTDDELEFKRLIYVDYTRAEYLMIIPYYSKESFGGILSKDTKIFVESQSSNYEKLYCDEIKYKDYFNLKNQVDSILAETIKNNLKEKKDKEKNIKHKSKSEQEKILSSLRNDSFNKRSHLYAYSNLAHDGDEEDPLDNEETKYKADEDNAKDIVSNFDNIYIPFKGNYIEKEPNIIPSNFPKGKEIGSALHKIFEKCDFTDYLSNDNDSKLELIIKRAFNEFKLKEPESENMKYVIDMVHSVLNAKLTVIKGNKNINETFKLSSISKNDKKEEVDFNFNIFKDRQLFEYFNGSIDLVFRRNDYYSILDWKSDSLNDSDLKLYYEFDYLEKHTKKNYAIQRVVYSYALIKWLNKKYKENSLEETFKKHFGGVYYVYIRGCSENTGNGIYCQTWESFKILEEAYKEIVSSLIINDDSNIIKLGGLNNDDIL